MDIAIVLSPCWGVQTPPCGLASLSAHLRANGHSVAVLDINKKLFFECSNEFQNWWKPEQVDFWNSPSLISYYINRNEQLIDSCVSEILETKANTIGFSIYNTTYYLSIEFARRIKKRDSNKKIIFGGPHCHRKIMGKEVIREGSVDIVVSGEGENTLSELLNLIKRNSAVSFCQGTLIKRNEDIVDCGDRPLIKDLNTLPFPDFSDFVLEDYRPLQGSPILPTFTSRGCINKCVYCGENQIYEGFRFRTGERIFDEITYQLRKYPCSKGIIFYDSAFNGNAKQLLRLCELIIESGLELTWQGQAIPHSGMNPELLYKMRESGCIGLIYGIESGSQRILDMMRKNINIKDVERVIRDTHKAGINVIVAFMFGFPGETEEDFRKTLDFVERNQEYITMVMPSPVFCHIGVGTYLYEHPEEYQIQLDSTGNYWSSENGKNNFIERLSRYEEFCNYCVDLGIKNLYSKFDEEDKFKQIGDYYFHLQDFQNAINFYGKVLEKNHLDRLMYRQIGICFKNQHNFEKAMIYLKRALSIDSSKSDPLNLMVEKDIAEIDYFA